MIEFNEIFSDSDKRVALWCENVDDTNDLAIMASNIIESKSKLISVPIESVAEFWACLEKYNPSILTRYNFAPINKDFDSIMDDFARTVTNVCKHGANGVQIFVKMRDFERFVENLMIIRDDLFFQNSLNIVMDIQDIDMSDMDMLFRKIRDVRANALTLTLNEDTGMQSDFVGRLYALLQNWNTTADLHFLLGNNFDRIDQSIRLIECFRPELMEKVRFFLDF